MENILKFFPDFDAFPLSPPSADAEVMRHLSDAKRQGEINSSFVKGVEEFKEIMKAKIGPKKSFVGPGLVTGAGRLSCIIYDYNLVPRASLSRPWERDCTDYCKGAFD